MKIAKILPVFILSINFLFGQENVKPCKDTLQVDEYYDNSISDDFILKDSLQKKIKIVFELNFDDKVWIFANNKMFFTGNIKTVRNLGVSLEMVDIDYSKFLQTPRISIIVGNPSNCVSFFPRLGKRIAYVNFLQGAWSIELSNIIREYR
jgi:hypothetical protein